jgi:hypothetical protein
MPTHKTDHKLLICVDWGRTTLSAFYTIIRKDGKVNENSISAVQFYNRGYSPTMIMTYDKSTDRVTWDYEARETLDNMQISADRVVNFLKVALYPQKDKEMKQRVKVINKQLKALDVDIRQLIRAHLDRVSLKR